MKLVILFLNLLETLHFEVAKCNFDYNYLNSVPQNTKRTIIEKKTTFLIYFLDAHLLHLVTELKLGNRVPPINTEN